MLAVALGSFLCLLPRLALLMLSAYVPPVSLHGLFSTNVPSQIDMSNIIDQAVKIIEANGFKDSMWYCCTSPFMFSSR